MDDLLDEGGKKVPRPVKRVTDALKRHRAPSLEKTLKLQEKLQALQAQFKSQQSTLIKMNDHKEATSAPTTVQLAPVSAPEDTSLETVLFFF